VATNNKRIKALRRNTLALAEKISHLSRFSWNLAICSTVKKAMYFWNGAEIRARRRSYRCGLCWLNDVGGRIDASSGSNVSSNPDFLQYRETP
jgi:hypothetical protein